MMAGCCIVAGPSALLSRVPHSRRSVARPEPRPSDYLRWQRTQLPGAARWCTLPDRSSSQRQRHSVAALAVAAAAPAAAAAAAAAAPLWSLPQLPEGWPLWTAFAVCAALGQLVERRTPVGGVLSAPLASLGFAMIGAAMGLLPSASSAADAIWAFLMPLGAACYLLDSDLSQLISSAGPTLLAFIVGALGTLAGTFIAFWLVGPRLGPEGYKVAAALCASYIGGAVNFAAVSQALALAPGALLAGAMTADNCVMALYIATIMSIPAEGDRQAAQAPSLSLAAAGAAAGAAGAAAVGGSAGEQQAQRAQQEQPQPAMTSESLSLTLAAAAIACCLGNWLASAAGMASSALAVMALLASGIGMLASKVTALLSKARGTGQAVVTPFAGADSVGGALMMLFFATIGASAGSLEVLSGCGWLVVFILLQLSIHLAICLAGGRLFNLPMQSVLIASNANVGGPATAAAMASAKGWSHMVQPAMLTGALGYAIATGIGIAVGGVLKTWY